MSFTILCPSIENEVGHFGTEPCNSTACSWWKKGCTAEGTVLKIYGAHIQPLPASPCPIQSQCRWFLEATRRGHISCGVQQLGMICEHQGGEWNTFEMAPPDEWTKEKVVVST
jgi:hypothetical protein